jgi:hypothetical protein
MLALIGKSIAIYLLSFNHYLLWVVFTYFVGIILLSFLLPFFVDWREFNHFDIADWAGFFGIIFCVPFVVAIVWFLLPFLLPIGLSILIRVGFRKGKNVITDLLQRDTREGIDIY